MDDIKLQDTVYNEELYDSDEDEEDTNFELLDEENDYFYNGVDSVNIDSWVW